MKKSDIPTAESITVPEGLSEKSQKLWASLVGGRVRSPGRVRLLEEALRSLDRSDQCRELVATEGLTKKTETTGAVHLNPILKAEREFRGQFIKTWATLGLEFDGQIDGRIDR